MLKSTFAQSRARARETRSCEYVCPPPPLYVLICRYENLTQHVLDNIGCFVLVRPTVKTGGICSV
jgi:hypothetical protein